MNTSSFLKQCIDEVVNESDTAPSKLSFQRSPKKSDVIKECVMEVLKESLTEGFDPCSDAGPNPTQENPYPEWNNKMRRMEEEDKGTVAHGRYAQEAGATPLLSTFTEIRNKLDPEGTKHDLTLKCVKCGQVNTCRCSKPKRTVEGVCDDCAAKSEVNESSIQWQCQHCKKVTTVLFEVTSPSDYASSSKCQHCGKTIGEMALDMKIYEEIIKHFAGHKKKVLIERQVSIPNYLRTYVQNNFGEYYYYAGVVDSNGKRTYKFRHPSDVGNRPEIQITSKNGKWFIGDTPIEFTPIGDMDVPIPVDAKSTQFVRPQPKPPKKFADPLTFEKEPQSRNADAAIRDLKSGSSGNIELDAWIKNAGLNKYETAVLCLKNRGYQINTIAKALGLKQSRAEAILNVAIRVVNQIRPMDVISPLK